MGSAAAVGHPAGGAGRPRVTPSLLSQTRFVRNGLIAAPLLVAAGGLWRGADGAASAAFGLAVATANLLVSARSLEWAGRVSLNAVAAVALGGYVVRLATITAVVLLVRNLGWVDLPALAVSLVVAHLGLLVWEARWIHLASEASGTGGDAGGAGRE